MDARDTWARLRLNRHVTDEAFDQCLPEWAQALSARHWTPVRIARRAAQLLVTRPGARILDVGSGVGKFCIIGALATAGRFTGVEQRGHLISLARKLVRRNGVARCAFLHGDATAIRWDDYDGIYLYNPFAEHVFEGVRQDAALEYGAEPYSRYVRFVEGILDLLRPGTRLVTYHGFGGEIPGGWQRMAIGRYASQLELWIKESAEGDVPLRRVEADGPP